ncbi:hypothetical protein TSAR_011311 [Trichomalopsis sarcophagae]|uniref:GH18 domain-containing protein n=1 Tax=Trichomalopsis sarcophagae TaxID=543379 RepID=A0A232ERK9_9HYME|nr:hypothetical protein TSAR_011311 [Trichomalopsis sarcophagae]
MPRVALLLLAAFLGLAAAYSTGNYNDNDRYNNQNNNYYNNQNQQRYNASQQRTKDIFCFLNATNIVRHPFHEVNSDTKGPFTVDIMKPELCTHIVYNAVELDIRSNNIRPVDPEVERDSGSQPTFSQLVHLKERNRHLKLILSVSGSYLDFFKLAQDSQRLPQFVNNVDQYLTRINFDGVNIDWRYPELNQRTVFTTFMTNLKSSLRNHGRLLTTVLHPYKRIVQEVYQQQQELFDVVDYWFIMIPDLAGEMFKSMATAPLKAGEGYDVDHSVTDLKEIFAQHSYKLILAIPFGGKQITTNHENTGFDMNRRGKPLTQESFAYNKICKIIRKDWQPTWIKGEEVPYAHNGNRIFAYEDAESVKIKTLYAMREGLGGVMAYTIDMDDYDGACTNSGSSYQNNKKYNEQSYRSSQDSSANKFPLLQSMYDTIQRGPNSAGVHTSSLALVLAIALAMILQHNA